MVALRKTGKVGLGQVTVSGREWLVAVMPLEADGFRAPAEYNKTPVGWAGALSIEWEVASRWAESVNGRLTRPGSGFRRQKAAIAGIEHGEDGNCKAGAGSLLSRSSTN